MGSGAGPRKDAMGDVLMSRPRTLVLADVIEARWVAHDLMAVRRSAATHEENGGGEAQRTTGQGSIPFASSFFSAGSAAY
jgi:hypothetical protein